MSRSSRMAGWLKAEIPVVLILALISLVLCGGSGFGTAVTAMLTASIGFCYLMSVLMHESGHYAALRCLGYDAVMTFRGRPEVTASDVAIPAARIAAIAGPLAGAMTGLLIFGAIMSVFKLNGYFHIFNAIFILSHLSMLLPVFPDGSVVISKGVI